MTTITDDQWFCSTRSATRLRLTAGRERGCCPADQLCSPSASARDRASTGPDRASHRPARRRASWRRHARESKRDGQPRFAAREHDDCIGARRKPVFGVQEEQPDPKSVGDRGREDENGEERANHQLDIKHAHDRPRCTPPARCRCARLRPSSEVGDCTRRRGDDPAVSCVQLDSISTVERSHRITLTSRVGIYRQGVVPSLLDRGRIFEYWAHEACLLPVEDWPLFVGAMRDGGRRWYGEVERTHPHLAGRDPGRDPHLAGRSHRATSRASTEGGMWNWKPAKAMLERLWNRGDLVIRGRQGFQRLYDLPERVLPREVLGAPPPGKPERLRTLALKAVRGARRAHRGRHRRALAAARAARALSARPSTGSSATGCSSGLQVDDGGAPVVVEPGAELDAQRADGGRAPLPVRQPALGSAVRAPRARLRPPDRGLQAGAASAATATTCCRFSGATASWAAPI